MADALAAPHPVTQKILGALRGVRLAPGLPSTATTTIAPFILIQHHQPEVVTRDKRAATGESGHEEEGRDGVYGVMCLVASKNSNAFAKTRRWTDGHQRTRRDEMLGGGVKSWWKRHTGGKGWYVP